MVKNHLDSFSPLYVCATIVSSCACKKLHSIFQQIVYNVRFEYYVRLLYALALVGLKCLGLCMTLLNKTVL